MINGLSRFASLALTQIFGLGSDDIAINIRNNDPKSREVYYQYLECLYDNDVYRNKFFKNHVFQQYFPSADPTTNIVGYFSPYKEIVEAHVNNIFPGVFGKDIKIDPIIDDDLVNPQLAVPVKKIWRSSNLDTEKSNFVRCAAKKGTAGIRIVPTKTSVALLLDDVSTIFALEEDSYGNVLAACIKYIEKVNDGTIDEPKYREQEVTDIITKDDFTKKIDGVTVYYAKNTYGFCPYVVWRFRDNTTLFGDPAFRGIDDSVHSINFRLSQQDQSFGDLMYPTWIFASSGDKPQKIILDGRRSAIWLKMLENSPKPMAQAIVPEVNQLDAMNFSFQLWDRMFKRQPELLINSVQLFSNVSGDAVQQVLKPAEAVIRGARVNAVHALVRAMQMAISIGIGKGFWDIGNGQGNFDIADDAFKTGTMAFTFADMPALPMTPAAQIQQAAADAAPQTQKLTQAGLAVSAGLSKITTYKIAGLSDKEAADEVARKTKDDLTVDNQL